MAGTTPAETRTTLDMENIAISQTFADWVSAFNDNNDLLEDCPLPISVVRGGDGNSGSTGMYAMRLLDGTLVMWGHLEHGTKDCSNDWASTGGSGFASETVTVNYPIASVTTPTVLARATDAGRCEVMCLPSRMDQPTLSAWKFVYWTPGSVYLQSQGNKSLDILVIGRWKS